MHKFIGSLINLLITLFALMIAVAAMAYTFSSPQISLLGHWRDLSLSWFIFLTLFATYYEEIKFGKHFNQYLYNHYDALPIFFSLLSNKTHVRVKFIRGAVYCGCILSYTFRFMQFAYQIRHITAQPEFIRLVNKFDKLLVSFWLLSSIVAILMACIAWLG